jgi:hypothetical protein
LYIVSAGLDGLMSLLAFETCARSTFPKTLGRITAAAADLMMTTTTMISMRVKPRAARKSEKSLIPQSKRGGQKRWLHQRAIE